MLEIWLSDASINSVEWSKNLNFISKFEVKNFELTNNFEKSRSAKITHAGSCTYNVNIVLSSESWLIIT